MQELIGLSTGPLRRPFQPRCVGGSSFGSELMTVSLSCVLMSVLSGGLVKLICVCVSAVFVPSLPHIRPTGTRLLQPSELPIAPLYWKVPKSQPVGACLSSVRTAMSIWMSATCLSTRGLFVLLGCCGLQGAL